MGVANQHGAVADDAGISQSAAAARQGATHGQQLRAAGDQQGMRHAAAILSPAASQRQKDGRAEGTHYRMGILMRALRANSMASA